MEEAEENVRADLVSERDLLAAFNHGQSVVLELLATNRPFSEIVQAICRHVETSMVGARCVAVRFVSDDELDLTSTGEVPDELQRAIQRAAVVHAEATRRGEQPECFEIPDPTNASATIWMLVVTGLGGQPIGALCVSREWPIHRRELTTHALHSAAHLLQLTIVQQRAAHNFNATIESERHRIANELHDDPIQAITVLSLTLQRLARSAPPELAVAIDIARLQADHAIDRMRRMLFELHPSVVEDEGLAVAVEVYLEETMEPLGIDWTLDDRSDVEPDVSTAVLAFRLAHEALSNVANHAGASSVVVTLTSADAGVTIDIVDDGVGFDPTSIAPHRPGHLGISHVRQLVQRIGGRFEIDSAPGSGCSVQILVPSDRAAPTG